MKLRSLGLILTMGAAMAAGLFAQGPRGNAPTPADRVTRQVNMLTRFLGLTADQQSKVTGILTADINNLETLTTTLGTDRQNLVAAIKANAGIPAAVSALSATQAQVETIRATEAAAIYALLDASQQAKLANGLGPLLGGQRGPGFGPRPRGRSGN